MPATLTERRFGIAPEETVTFGDAMNDIPMFLVTPNSYAVQTAEESVRALAVYTVQPPELNGIANCLHQLIGT